MRITHRNLEKVLQSLEHHDLSTIPSVLVRLLSVSRDPKSNASDLAAVCEMDKATSARLLRAANSVYFATENRDRVDSLKDAIVRIGFEVSEEIIMSATVSSMLKSNTALADYSSNALWRHSIGVAIASRLIYKMKFRDRALDPFMVGLLHDLGIALEHQFLFNDGFQTAIAQRAEKKSLLTEEEESCLGVTHEDIGAAVACKWNFPEHLVTVIGHHHRMKAETDEYDHLLHTVRLAEFLCYQQQQGYSDFSEEHAAVLAESRQVLDVVDDELTYINEQLTREMTNLVNLGWFSELRFKLR